MNSRREFLKRLSVSTGVGLAATTGLYSLDSLSASSKSLVVEAFLALAMLLAIMVQPLEFYRQAIAKKESELEMRREAGRQKKQGNNS